MFFALFETNQGQPSVVVLRSNENKQLNDERKHSMKLKQVLTMCAMASALFLSVGSLSAQNNNGGNNNGGNGGGGRGNFDPAQMQQRMMDNIKDQLGFTNDTDWNAVQPLVQKVLDARRDVGGNAMGRMFGGRNRGGQGGGNRRGGGMFGTPSPEAEALQKLIDDNAPAAQITDSLEKYRAAQKTKQAALVQAQKDLQQVLSPGKQEAQAALLGLVE
jgi:hypothetical protein